MLNKILNYIHLIVLIKNRKMNKKRTETFDFKIIAGSLKGKTITAPDLGITRPPLTRLRKAIFDFLNPYLEEADYLDLSAGQVRICLKLFHAEFAQQQG